jgi:hypothetical protein
MSECRIVAGRGSSTGTLLEHQWGRVPDWPGACSQRNRMCEAPRQGSGQIRDFAVMRSGHALGRDQATGPVGKVPPGAVSAG